MSPVGKGVLYGALVASAYLIGALVISEPDGVTLTLAIAMGVAVALVTWYQDRRR